VVGRLGSAAQMAAPVLGAYNDAFLGMQESFAQSLGLIPEDGEFDMKVSYPKYALIRHTADRFVLVLETFAAAGVMAAEPGARLAAYAAALRAQHAADMPEVDTAAAGPPPPPAELRPGVYDGRDFDALTPEARKHFADVYVAGRKCNLAKLIMITAKALVPHKAALEDPAALSDAFLTRGAGTTYEPLPDSGLNFRRLYSDPALPEGGQALILTVLHKLYTLGHQMYESLASPDVDIERFVTQIQLSLSRVEDQLPACASGFRKLLGSLHLLRSNFTDYYKNYIATDNPTIIMEGFLGDVAKTSLNVSEVAQIRKIIAHYRKASGTRGAAFSTLFDRVDSQFTEYERATRRATASAAVAAAAETANAGAGAGAGDSFDAAAAAAGRAYGKKPRRKKAAPKTARRRGAPAATDASDATDTGEVKKNGPCLAEEFE
jgi:hypothetical protein